MSSNARETSSSSHFWRESPAPRSARRLSNLPRAGRLRGLAEILVSLEYVVVGGRRRRGAGYAAAAAVVAEPAAEVEQGQSDRAGVALSRTARSLLGSIRRSVPRGAEELSAGVFLRTVPDLGGFPVRAAQGSHGVVPSGGNRNLGNVERIRPLCA